MSEARLCQDPAKVEALIAEAQNHPLGLEFLLEGDLASVAAMFEVHAFTIEAARESVKSASKTMPVKE